MDRDNTRNNDVLVQKTTLKLLEDEKGNIKPNSKLYNMNSANFSKTYPVFFHQETLTKTAEEQKVYNTESPFSNFPAGLKLKVPVKIEKSLKKKKKKKRPYEYDEELEARRLHEQHERERIERERALIVYDTEMHSFIELSDKIMVLSSGIGYSTIVARKNMTIQKHIEQGAGFQPFESSEAKNLHIVTIMTWRYPREWDELTERLKIFGVDYTYVSNKKEIESWINKKW